MKIEIQKKFYIWLKSEIEEKNQYSKKTKKNNKKNKDRNWCKKIKTNFSLKGEIKNKNNFRKRKKIKKNEDQIGKNNIP
jgi:hypothetical protein